MKKLLLALLLIVTPANAYELENWMLGNMSKPDITKRDTWQGYEYNIGNYMYESSRGLMTTITLWARTWMPADRKFYYIEVRFHCINNTKDYLFHDTRRPMLDFREYINPGHTDWIIFSRLCAYVP